MVSTGPWSRQLDDAEQRIGLDPDGEPAGRAHHLAVEAQRRAPVEIELDVKARFIEEDLMQWNTIAEIPGTDKKDEVVMLGAHIDSWHGATGATDNGAGRVNAACARGLAFDLLEVRRVEKILVDALEREPAPGERGAVVALPARFVRPPQSFAHHPKEETADGDRP